MDGSRKLIVALGALAAVSTTTAVALALRTPAESPPAALPSTPPRGEVVTADPRAPGGPNAIAVKATESGGPRTPTVALGAGAPRRAVVSFRVPVDGAAPGSAWTCIAAAGRHAAGHLDAGGTFDGMEDPAVAAACAGTGTDALEGFVRLAVAPIKIGESACEATVSYTLTRGGVKAAAREVRGVRAPGDVPDNCTASLTALEKSFAKKIAEP